MPDATPVDWDMKMRLAADRVLRAITLKRQAKVAMLASAALSVAAAARPELLPPDLMALAGILEVNAINDLLKDVAVNDELFDEDIVVRMEALLPVDKLDQLVTSQNDLLRALTKQHSWLTLIIDLNKTNETKTAELIELVLRMTGDLNLIRQQLASIASEQTVEKLIARVLHSMQCRKLDVPVVVAAMTSYQAHELDKYRAWKATKLLPLHKKYTKLRDDEWIEHYRPTPDEWIPFFSPSSSPKTIWEIVNTLIAGMNASMGESDDILIQPKSLSKEFFNPSQQNNTFLELTQRGGILIIDPLSLNHPDVSDAVINSHAFGNPNISTIVVNPLDLSLIKIHSVLKELVQVKLSLFYSRFANGLDNRSEFSGGDIIYLQRWLFERIKDFKNESRKRAMSDVRRENFYSQTAINRNSDGSQLADIFRQQ